MFDGLSTELMGAAIYDLGKGIIGSVSTTEWVQATLMKWKLTGEQHDFAARYLETLVEFRLQDKQVAILNLFRSDDIRRTFFDFYYGTPEKKGNEAVQQQSLGQCIEALRVGDEIKVSDVNVEAEVSSFWTVFRQKVHESRPVRDVETNQKLDQIQRSIDDAVFNGLVDQLQKNSIPNSVQISRHRPVKWVSDRPYIGRAKDVERLKSFFEHPQKPFFFLYGVGGIGKSHLLQVVDANLKTRPAYFRLNESTNLSSLIRDLGYGDVETLTPLQQRDYFLKKTAVEDQPLVFDDLYELPEDDILFHTVLELSNQPTGKFLVISRALPLGVEIKEERRLGLNELSENDFEQHLKDYHKAAHYDFELSPQLINACYCICKGYPLGGEFLLKLREVSGEDFSEDIDSIGEIDPKTDTSHRDFMEHLLDSIFKRGSDNERDLAKQMAVFMDPMPIKVFEELPAFDPDAFHALTERKKIFYALKGKVFGAHTLVRKILETKNGVSHIAHVFAGRYYERIGQTEKGLDFESLFKAHFHFEQSKDGVEEGYYDDFVDRWTPEYGDLSVKKLLKRKDSQLFDKFRFKLLLKQDHDSKLDVARVLRHSGKPIEAISLLTTLVESNYLRAYVELGIAYHESGDIANAIYVLERGAEAGDLFSTTQLGIIYREAKRYNEAINILKRSAKTGDMFAMTQLMITYRETKRIDEAIEFMEKAIELGEVVSMTQLGGLYREVNRIEESINILKKLAEAGDVFALTQLVTMYRETKRIDEAIEFMEKAIELGEVVSMTQLGVLYREVNRLEESINVLKKLAEAGDLFAMTQLGITYREAKRLPEAIKVLEKAVDARSVHAMNELGVLYRAVGRYDEAIDVLIKSVDAGNLLSIDQLGITYRKMRRYGDAIDVLRKAADEGIVSTMTELGITYREMRRYDDSIDVLKRAADLHPSDIIVLNELGQAYMCVRRYGDAIDVLKKAVAAGNIQSFNVLGVTYRKMRRYGDAIDILKKAVAAENIQSFNELGITYREAKRLPEAIDILKKAVDAGHIPSVNELSITYLVAKRLPEAIEELKNGLKKKPNEIYLKYTLLKIYMLYQPNPAKAKQLFLELPFHFPSGRIRKSFEQVILNFDAILTLENRDLSLYRTYIWLLFRYESWDMGVAFLEKLLKIRKTIEFQSNLGKALSHIGRSNEAVSILLTAMEDTRQPGKEKYFSRIVADYLDALKLAGKNKEARKKFEIYKDILSSLPNFETRKAYWLSEQG